jgi:hypothetical protein
MQELAFRLGKTLLSQGFLLYSLLLFLLNTTYSGQTSRSAVVVVVVVVLHQLSLACLKQTWCLVAWLSKVVL